MAKTAVFIIKGDGFKGMEGETALRVMRRLFHEGSGTLDIFELDKNSPLKIKDLRGYKGYDVFVVIGGILFITHEGINHLSTIVRKRKEFSVIVPVSNESNVLYQRHAPPFFYQTLSVFIWAAEEIHREFKNKVTEAGEIDDFCFAFRRELLNDLPGGHDVIDLQTVMKNRGLRYGVAKGVYAHRYGNCYESSRDDLMAHVPLNAREVLDIGSARGLFGELLKKRQRCVVTGVDNDSELIPVAGNRLDRVIEGDIEDLVDKGILGIYDCIVCGDVLEHLNNPWKVVRGLKNHLRKGGLFIASTPNIMNWAIIFEQLKGRWDYVPFSILSGTHIRFFTRDTLKDLFEDAGYKTKKMLLQSFEIPPLGAEFIAGLKNLMKEMDEEELKASEMIVVAEG